MISQVCVVLSDALTVQCQSQCTVQTLISHTLTALTDRMVLKTSNAKFLHPGQQLAFQPQHHGWVNLLRNCVCNGQAQGSREQNDLLPSSKKTFFFFALGSQILYRHWNVDESSCPPSYSWSKYCREHGQHVNTCLYCTVTHKWWKQIKSMNYYKKATIQQECTVSRLYERVLYSKNVTPFHGTRLM